MQTIDLFPFIECGARRPLSGCAMLRMPPFSSNGRFA